MPKSQFPMMDSSPKQNITERYYKLSQLKPIQCGSQFSLTPIDAGFLVEEDLEAIVKLAKGSPRLQQFLPNMDLRSVESVSKFFMGLCIKTESFLGFGYAIRYNNFIIGMIFVNTPLFNKNAIRLDKWTLDFFFFQPFEGNGLMHQFLLRFLHFLQQFFNLDEILCIVDQNNSRCLSLMNKLPFDEIDNSLFCTIGSSKKPRVFSVDLSTITFRKI